MAFLLPPPFSEPALPAPSSFSAISSMPAAFTPPWGMAAWAFTPVAVISARPSPAAAADRRNFSWAFSISASRALSSSSAMWSRPTTAFASAGTTLGRSPAYSE